jgi:hypothetical protein
MLSRRPINGSTWCGTHLKGHGVPTTLSNHLPNLCSDFLAYSITIMFPTFSETVLTIVLFASAVCSTTAYARPSATINAGVVVGAATSVPSSTNTVNKFLGIPFAAPPVRFAPPVPPKPWTKPFQATKNAPSCIQQFPNELIESLVNNPPPEAGESEDCLYINVYAPASPAPKGGRTVMFWLYGGDLVCGHNSWPYYDGSNFAAHQDVIIVAPNYRTNGR